MGALEQYEVTQGGFSAEYGENAGAVVSVTTKSGTNQFKVTYNTLIKPKALNSKIKSGLPNQVNDKATSSTHFEEFSVSGAIVRDRLFFFDSLQYQNLYTGNLVAPKTLNSMYYGNVLKLTWNRTNRCTSVLTQHSKSRFGQKVTVMKFNAFSQAQFASSDSHILNPDVFFTTVHHGAPVNIHHPCLPRRTGTGPEENVRESDSSCQDCALQP